MLGQLVVLFNEVVIFNVNEINIDGEICDKEIFNEEVVTTENNGSVVL